MAHNLIIRGFDDEVHSQLGELSRQKGVSITLYCKGCSRQVAETAKRDTQTASSYNL